MDLGLLAYEAGKIIVSIKRRKTVFEGENDLVGTFFFA